MDIQAIAIYYKKINTISTYLQLAAAYTLELKYSLNKTIIL